MEVIILIENDLIWCKHCCIDIKCFRKFKSTKILNSCISAIYWIAPTSVIQSKKEGRKEQWFNWIFDDYWPACKVWTFCICNLSTCLSLFLSFSLFCLFLSFSTFIIHRLFVTRNEETRTCAKNYRNFVFFVTFFLLNEMLRKKQILAMIRLKMYRFVE